MNYKTSSGLVWWVIDINPLYFLYITNCILLLHSESLKVEKTKAGHYLCMGQYLNITSHCRIPGKVTDSQRSTPIEKSHHIIVMHNDHVSDYLLFHVAIAVVVN